MQHCTWYSCSSVILRSAREHKSLLLLTELEIANLTPERGPELFVLSSSPWSDRIKGSWVVCGLHNCGVILGMGTWKKILSCSQIISSNQHKYNLTGAGRRQPVAYFQAWQMIWTQDDRKHTQLVVRGGIAGLESPARWLLSHAVSSWYHIGTTTRVNRWMKSVHWFLEYLECHTFCKHFCKSAHCAKKST